MNLRLIRILSLIVLSQPERDLIMATVRDEFKTLSEEELLNLHLSSIHSDKDHFVKPRGHFEDKATEFVPFKNQKEYHTFTTFKKCHKVGSSKQRNENEWIEITSSVVDDKFKEEFCRFNVLMGEIFRFELGSVLPKYRIEKCLDGSYKLLTKKLKNCDGSDFFDFYDKNIYKKSKFKIIHKAGKDIYEVTPPIEDFIIEGIGGACAMKYLYVEDDFTLSNALAISVEGYIVFIPLDHDRCLWPFPQQFYNGRTKKIEPLESMKIMQYVSEYINSQKRYNEEEKVFQYSHADDIKYKDIGEQHEEDYVTLPLVKHKTPRNWEWMQHLIKSFAKKVSDNPTVKSEVSFFRLKASLTSYLKKFLVEYHFGRDPKFSKLKTELNDKIQQELLQLKKINEQSSVIRDFMREHRIASLQAMLYEVNLAFHDNKHYLPKDKSIWENIWINVSNMVINNFNAMLTAQALPLLNDEEKEGLKIFSINCENDLTKVLPDVVKFYETMGRQCAADVTKKKLNAAIAEKSILTPEKTDKQEENFSVDSPQFTCSRFSI